jgi:UDP-GlcNAc:undecaprenyl-phosphate/decaprenyl-phosphate GlcNAc-1-phosphate transferase
MKLWEPLSLTALAFVVTLALLPIVRYFGKKLKLYDPTGPLKIHNRPITRFGGVAMMAGLATSAAIFAASGHPLGFTTCAAVFMLWLVSAVDDFDGVSPILRLAFQVAAAVLLWLDSWRLPVTSFVVANFLVTVLVIVFFVNAFNMLDGADGLAAGVAGIVAGGYLVADLASANAFGAAFAASLLGVCAAFLFFNFHPASMFMGDSGSTLLGLLVAMLGIDFFRWSPHGRGRWILPLLFAALPLADAALAIVRRVWRGQSPLAGDRDHSYDLLLRRGWSVPQVAVCSYCLTGILVMAGISVTCVH